MERTSSSRRLSSSIGAHDATRLHISLHERVMVREDDAIEELFRRLRPILRRQLRGVFRLTPLHTIADAVEDALVEYALRPQCFDHSRGVPLVRFLFQIAWRNLVDLVRADVRRRRRERLFAEAARAPTHPQDDDGSAIVARALTTAATTGESEALARWFAGERRTAPLAAALGLTHLPAPEQRREVKRFKDRVLKRLARGRLILSDSSTTASAVRHG